MNTDYDITPREVGDDDAEAGVQGRWLLRHKRTAHVVIVALLRGPEHSAAPSLNCTCGYALCPHRQIVLDLLHPQTPEKAPAA